MLYKKLLVVSFFLGVHNFSHAMVHNFFGSMEEILSSKKEFQRRSKVIENALKDGNKDEINRVKQEEIAFLGFIISDSDEDKKALDDTKTIKESQKEFQKVSAKNKEQIIEFVKICYEYNVLLKKLNLDSQLIAALELRFYYFKVVTGQLSLWDRFIWSSALTKCAVVGGTVIVSYIAYKLYLAYFDTNEHGEEYTPQNFYSSNR